MTATFIVAVVVAVSPLASVAVALMLSAMSTLLLCGGVTVKPSSCSPLSVQVPSLLLMPALRTAPVGTPDIVIDRLSEPSVSPSTAEISSAIAVSSRPAASPMVTVGASASPLTDTVNGTWVVAVSPSFSVAVTLSAIDISPAKFAGGRMLTFGRSAAGTDHTPGLTCEPAFSCAPSGTPLMVMLSVSEPSVSSDMALSRFNWIH